MDIFFISDYRLIPYEEISGVFILSRKTTSGKIVFLTWNVLSTMGKIISLTGNVTSTMGKNIFLTWNVVFTMWEIVSLTGKIVSLTGKIKIPVF